MNQSDDPGWRGRVQKILADLRCTQQARETGENMQVLADVRSQQEEEKFDGRAIDCAVINAAGMAPEDKDGALAHAGDGVAGVR